MRIVVITSCTGEKAVESPEALTLEDFQKGPAHVKAREKALGSLLMPAEDLYTGQQHVRLMRGIKAFRAQAPKHTLDLFVLSAGYGVVKGDQKLAPYEATFATLKKGPLRKWADQLGVRQAFRETLAAPYDLALVLLGDDYLEACLLDADLKLGGPTLLFCGGTTHKKLPVVRRLRAVPLSNREAKRFSCGLVALKGDLAARVLGMVAGGPEPLDALLGSEDVLTRLEQESAPSNVLTFARPVPPPVSSLAPVDYVISIPASWKEKPHRARLRYFIPEWDDTVDRDFDFQNDVHSGGKGNWTTEVYAHQMYAEPNYDGILISKVVAEKSKSKKKRINELGVHRMVRVPRDFPIMGDCGAFGYIGQKVPPYTTPEILDYYTRLDFDYGVSIDHLIVKATASEKNERYEITLHNAEEFINEHKKRGLPWTPIGAVQGWDPLSYANAAQKLVAMGYQYIAIGGLVRTPTKDVLRLLEQVHPVVPSHVQMHLFGLARINAMDAFAKLGVTSVDSASLLRRAWMGTGQNYMTMDGQFYAAIRIPESGKSFRAKRMVSEERASEQKVEAMDKACLDAMNRFDQGLMSVESVLDVLEEYDHLITPDRPINRNMFREVLEARPWKHCPCEICRKDGIQVIIFRGNNRNRRRGFHNTYAFYRLMQRALAGESVGFRRGSSKLNLQQSLFDLDELGDGDDAL